MFDPLRYADALRFAAERHQTQRVPGTELPYIAHVTWVTAEVIAALPSTPNLDAELAVLCAVLHDTIEDTGTTRDEVAARFGPAIADGVQALSKAPLPAGLDPAGKRAMKRQQMEDSLRRIREQPSAVWAVKLADRITNLAPPPSSWSAEKCRGYREEAILIADALAGVSEHLDTRIHTRIEAYAAFC